MNRMINSIRSIIDSRPFWLFLFAAILSVSVYLALSASTYRIGFPLDDAWIHQTYARNFARFGEWSYLPNQPSAGSTSPLWSFLLALGYWLRIPYLYWTFLLGGICLAALGILAARIINAVAPSESIASVLYGLFLVFEWHLVWSAVSGMETLLFGLVSLVVMVGLLRQKPGWFILGLSVGLSIWLRPDGITLLGPVLLSAVIAAGDWKRKMSAVLSILIGALIFAIPYGLFNRSLSGAWLPNTFFAKQAEYAVIYHTPLGTRVFQQIKTLLIGPAAILMPGFIWGVLVFTRQKKWNMIGMAIWVMGYISIYAYRLPVTYQHGRYLMPVLPVFFVLALIGMQEWVSRRVMAFWHRVLIKSWQLSLILLTLIFFFLGGRAYAQDVAVIESEMVAAANWIAANTPGDALIAAHDIGALGYFGNRSLLDLAGLISPDIIPFIRDESRIAAYLDEKDVDYLMTFPDWYPDLVKKGTLIFDTEGKFSPAIGGENMQIYRWH